MATALRQRDWAAEEEQGAEGILAFWFFLKPLYEFFIHNLRDVSDSFFVHGVRILIPVFIYCDIGCV